MFFVVEYVYFYIISIKDFIKNNWDNYLDYLVIKYFNLKIIINDNENVRLLLNMIVLFEYLLR